MNNSISKIKNIKAGDELVCIGHITHDRVITPKFEANMPGGTAYYFAKALKDFESKNVKIVTSVGKDAEHVLEELRRDGMELISLPGKATVFFENKYGTDMNDRTQRVLAKADPFTIDKLQNVKGSVFHLGTLLADDFSPEVIRFLSKRGIVSLDVQGYLRTVEGSAVTATDYVDKKEALPYVDILKANEQEMEILTGTSDPRKAALILSDMGVREVLFTLGDKGSLIYANEKFHEIPAFPVDDPVDATGCGDTYMAGYLYKRCQGASIEESGRFAAAMCSLKLANKGPFCGKESEVYEKMGS